MLRKWTILVSIIITVSGITVFSFGTFSAFAQTNELLSVNTSENSYEEGDTIIIFGNVSSIISETPVTLQIFHKGNLVDIIQVTVAQDGKFTHTMLAKGPLWQKEGTYIVRASYGANGVVETSFEFLKQMKPNEFESRYKTNPLAENFNMSEVVFDWWHYGTYNIKYSHIGGDPNGYPNIRLEGKTLRIVVDQATNGYFLIGIPRSFLNSYYFCDEYPFDISNSIQKEDWEEISSGDIRFIKINLSASKTTYLIEIRGTDLMKDAQDKIKECGHPVKAINNPNWMMVGDDTMKKEIFIKQSVDYIDDLGYLHIVGEVVNNKDKPINFVKVIASIYDADKNFIDSSFSYTTLEIIPPYAKSPFDVIFSGGSLGIDSYKLQIEYLLSQPLPLKLYAKQPRITDDELGYVHVKGEIQNTGDQTAHFIKVVGNIYDSNQTLIGTSFVFTTRIDIYPNQSSPYDLVFTDLLGDPVSYQIYAESIEYGMYYEYPTSTIDLTQIDSVGEITQENKQTLLKCGEGTIEKNGECISLIHEKGGCLIATATYGSELVSQVQQLRELRDNNLLKTNSGSTFMESFNQFYYLFSPTIADWERQNSAFKEVVKIVITPLLTSLSILNYVDIDSEAEVLGYGISLILLNIAMYVATPIGIGLFVVSRKSKNP